MQDLFKHKMTKHIISQILFIIYSLVEMRNFRLSANRKFQTLPTNKVHKLVQTYFNLSFVTNISTKKVSNWKNTLMS
jgi:hypothetical protein